MLNLRRSSLAGAIGVTQPAIPPILRAAIDSNPACAAVLDGRARVLAVNAAWRRFARASGVRVSRVLGAMSYLAFWAAAGFEGPSLARTLANLVEAEEACCLEYTRNGSSGRRSFELRLMHLPGEGAARVLAVHADVTAGARSGRERGAADEPSRIQDDERRRIARELHDTTGQNLSAAVLDLQRALSLLGPEPREPQPMIAEALALCLRSLEEIRTLAYQLHPPMLDEAGLLPALKWYVHAFSRRSGVKVDLRVPPVLEPLPIATATALFRVAQEALLNVHRHSGSSTALVRMVRQAGAVRLDVSDRGHGLAPARSAGALGSSPGIGIQNMRDRIRSFGGRLEVTSSARGTLVRAIVPSSEEPDASDPARGRS